MGLLSWQAARSLWKNGKRAQRRRMGRELLAMESLETRQLLSLMVDVRLPGGAKSAEVTQAGGTVEMEVWATVTGADQSGANDGLLLFQGSLVSTDIGGGAVRGDLTATPLDPFTAAGSSSGQRQDLDGDGDLDIGDTDPANTAADRFGGRSGQFAVGNAEPGSASFKIGTLTMSIDQLLPGQQTEIRFLPLNANGAIWLEDGQQKTTANGTFEAGAPMVLTSIQGEDTAKPQATLLVDNVTQGGDTWHYFEVHYSDDIGIKLDTLDDYDLVVQAPNGAKLPVYFLEASRTTDGTPVAAAYWFDAPGGYFDSLDNGTYAVWLKPKQVTDLSGKSADTWTNLGSFTVNAPPAIRKAKWLIVNGTNGKDKITVAKQNQSIVATVNGVPYTFSATAIKNIQVLGFNNNDNITIGAGLGGVNVDGGAGNDRIYGGDGNDTLLGGAGNDTIDGGAGNDSLNGEDGDDQIAGGLGADLVLGGIGNDKLYGGAGSDSLNGGAGLDWLYGDADNDLFVTRDKEIDRLFGGVGADSVRGDRNDLLSSVENVLK